MSAPFGTEIVAGEERGPAASRKPAVAAPPKWEMDTRERLKSWIKKTAKPLADLAGRDANEGDTRLLVTDFLCDALGFDKYEDLTTEYLVKGEFADYGIRVEKQLVAFVEVKRITTKLSAKHLRQVEMYAVNEGVEWMILTNGSHWQAYHLTPGMPVQIDLALDVSLLGEGTVAEKAGHLFYLTRESLKRRQIDDLWKTKRAASPKSIASVLTSDAVTDAIRKELRKRTAQNVDPVVIRKVLMESVISTDCVG